MFFFIFSCVFYLNIVQVPSGKLSEFSFLFTEEFEYRVDCLFDFENGSELEWEPFFKADSFQSFGECLVRLA